MQDAFAAVALRLESLKAAVAHKELGGGQDAHQLAAIMSLTQELEALLQPQDPAAAAAGPHSAPGAAMQGAAAAEAAMAQPAAAAAVKAAGLPATPFEQRRVPATGPATAVKAPAPTPGGGLPATTPLAAEVLASLNNLGPGGGGGSNVAAATAGPAVAADRADGDAAATLSGLFGGMDRLPSGAGSTLLQQQQQAAAAHADPALASLLQGSQLLGPPLPAHAAVMAAAAAVAAAGPALPVPRRQSATLPMLPPLGASQAREQRPCNCKRSMCLKMYCECFAAGGFCAPSCSCLSCSNTPAEMGVVMAAREVVLAKNPNAFEVKVTAATGHRRGCRCKRSKCLKKYCECFHAGARCNPEVCQCEDCRNTEGDAMLLPLLGRAKAQAAAWADASPDVLAMFQQPLPPLAAAGSGGSQASDGEGGARGLPLPHAPFSFALPPMPEPALHSAGSLPAFQPATSASLLAAFPPGSLFAPPPMPEFDPAAAAAFQLHPAAAAAAATFAAAATVAEQQAQLEESMADAASFPVAAPGAPPAVPAAARVASALTSHLSDVAGEAADPEMHDTATSPAPHMAVAKLAARRTLAAAMAPTLTGGAAAGNTGRPPLPSSRVRSRAASPLSQGSADENGGDSLNTAGSQRGKRPRRAASGGVLGAVAAEASEWGLGVVSPPLKRANSLPPGLDASKCGGAPRGCKVSDRVALLKRALAGETVAVAAAQQKKMGGGLPLGVDGGAPTAEDADAVSALFELSSSMC